jgi:hypothetical protein
VLNNASEKGKIFVYVKDSFALGGSSTINNGGNANKAIMYYKGSAEVNTGGNTRFVGSIYVNSANVSIGGSNGIYGDIISGGGTVNVSGAAQAHVRVLYAPNAYLNMTGSGAIRGVAVVNTCSLSGASTITADSSLDTTFFESLDWGADGPPSLLFNDPEPETPIQDTSGVSWRNKGTWSKL